MGYIPPKTQKGYALSDVVSALQKDIRRGNERQAMFWAMEFVPQYEKYLWRRLLVIAHEDVGIANPDLFLLIPQLRDTYFEFREGGNDAAYLMIANAVLMLCRSPKTRIADHFQAVVIHARETGLKIDVPDYALDQFTARGKAMKRGEKFFQEVSGKIIPEAETPDPYHEEAAELWVNTPGGQKWPTVEKSTKTEQKQQDEQIKMFERESTLFSLAREESGAISEL